RISSRGRASGAQTGTIGGLDKPSKGEASKKGLDHHPTNEGFACGSNCRGWIIIRRTIRRLRRMISISSSLHLVRWREVVGLLVVPIAGVGSSSDE
ncbi:hypothetical protein LINPERPRIM_LOCUS39492, partial [Linum perenne]